MAGADTGSVVTPAPAGHIETELGETELSAEIVREAGALALSRFQDPEMAVRRSVKGLDSAVPESGIGTADLPSELIDFTDACVAAVAGDDPRATLRRLMEDLVAEPETLAAQLEPLGPVDRTPSGLELGAEATLYEDEKLTVSLLDTYPGVLQPPHDHRMTAIIGVFEGEEDQRLFVRGEGGIRPTAGRTLGSGEVMTLGSQAIHAISAPSGTARAVHVYLGSINTVKRSLFHPETLAETPMESSVYHDYCRPVAP